MQASLDVWAGGSLYLPATQPVQAVRANCPVSDWYFPAKHSVHCTAALGVVAHFPASQSMQAADDATVALYCPAVHTAAVAAEPLPE
jgi:hypothetical protein